MYNGYTMGIVLMGFGVHHAYGVHHEYMYVCFWPAKRRMEIMLKNANCRPVASLPDIQFMQYLHVPFQGLIATSTVTKDIKLLISLFSAQTTLYHLGTALPEGESQEHTQGSADRPHDSAEGEHVVLGLGKITQAQY